MVVRTPQSARLPVVPNIVPRYEKIIGLPDEER